ncbi:hypothetical protein [Burkholderia gladioli]|uniref:hypothetical protein n=1 Tax=Burkholderia gladioli TaxID=28095 RepID=UPI00164036BA|nr:hypothetical protein [Burkholderia gladioli]MBU9215060.1 hypothetical protein [Burkholderia gladioli]MDN7722665.1 hypothetical protein [Burkholderia gladioli]
MSSITPLGISLAQVVGPLVAWAKTHQPEIAERASVSIRARRRRKAPGPAARKAPRQAAEGEDRSRP